MPIFYNNEDSSFDFNQEVISDWINYTISNEDCFTGNVSYILCSDEYLLNINKQFLNHDYYTDVITFDYVSDKTISGDIFISIDRIVENAKLYSVSCETELFRVMIHGVLHLIGYDDLTEEEEKIIHAKEDYYLNVLKSKFVL